MAQTATLTSGDPAATKVKSDFQSRVQRYLAQRQRQAGNPPAPSTSPEKLVQAQKDLAAKMQKARANARQGEIFTPPIADYFRKQIALTFKSTEGPKIRASLRNSEPVKGVQVKINQPYPEGVPLQSTPPTLLLNLPALPKQIEYRIVNDDLVLLDTATNLVVDFIPHAISPS